MPSTACRHNTLPDRFIRWGFALMPLSGGFIFMGWYSNTAWIASTFLATALVGIYGLRSVYFAIMNRGAIPFGLLGTVGLLGFITSLFFGRYTKPITSMPEGG